MSDNKLLAILNGLEYIEVISDKSSDTQMKIRHRVHDNSAWLKLLYAILTETTKCSIHACRQYIMHPDTTKLVYVWNFIISMVDDAWSIDQVIDDVCSVIEKATNTVVVKNRAQPQQRKDTGIRLDSYPLMGRPDRNVPEADLRSRTGSVKGAHPIPIRKMT